MGLNLNINSTLTKKVAIPPVPTDVVITVVSDTAFSVAYVSTKSVEIWYSTTEGGVYTKHGDDTATPYPMTGLTAGTEYWVKARAKNGSKFSAFTAASSATTYAPNFSDALFLLNGDIVTIGESKYFQDKTANGRNFLITGYDFDSTWTKGFPYKSAATISAPAGDAALIAADINNYLYDSGGTPNAIPVISLFQDVDYEHKLFARHEAQVVDGNGVETYEPRVKDIVLYTNVKSGADLTKCQTYYGVPAIVAEAKFIDPVNGIDASGDGTQGNPYKTHSKVNGLSLTEGIQIYCLTGVIVPFAWNSNYNLKSIGRTEIVNVSGTRGIDYGHAGTLAQNISGYIIDMASVLYSQGINATINAHDLTLEKIYFKNNNYPAHNGTSTGMFKVIAKNNIYTANVKNIDQAVVDIDTCYANAGTQFMWGNVTNGHIIVKNSKFVNIASNFIRLYKPLNFTFYGNKYINSASLVLFAHANANAGTISITNNTLISSVNTAFLSLQRDAYTIIFDNNYSEYTELTSALCIIEGNVNQANNNIIINGKITAAILDFTNSMAHTKTVKCNNNLIKNNNKDCSYLVRVGTESTSAYDNKITYAELLNNNLYGYLNSGAETTATHGFLVGFVADYLIKYNKSIGNYIGGVIKGGVNSNNICSSNIFANNTIGSWFKAATYCNYINNTILGSGEAYRMTTNDAVGCSDMVLKNNFIQSSTVTITSSTGTFNYNIYKSGVTIILDSVNKTFTQFAALGNEANGVESTITFNADYTPVTPQSIAEDLGASFDDGLDASTDWGFDTELPVVVTKQQGAAWDIGAYVH